MITQEQRDKATQNLERLRNGLMDRLGYVQRKLVVVHRDTDLSRNAEYQRAVWNAHAAAEKAFAAAQEVQSTLEAYFDNILTLLDREGHS